jgi:hypothetical protein
MNKAVLLILSLGLMSASAFAASSVQVSEISSDGVDVTGVTYGTNASLGRAWLNIETYDRSCSGGDGCDAASSFRVKVEGLSLVNDQVVAADGTVCAAIVHHKFGPFKSTRVKATGLCGIRTEPGTRSTDDGYEIHTEKTVRIFFETK